jgi:hypothetical protein
MWCHSSSYRHACPAACLAAGKQAVDKARPETIADREKEKANSENMRKHERYF